MISRVIALILLFSLFLLSGYGQIVINEYLSSNTTGITDEDGDRNDWIELYNKSGQSINLLGYQLSDSRTDTTGWIFPDITIPANSFVVVYASGKDRGGVSMKYHTLISRGYDWRYLIPTDYVSANWREPEYDDSFWLTGPSGFGYGDNDDATILENVSVLLLRKEFEIDDVNLISKLLLHVDYDDGFIAFINGEKVALGGIAENSDDYTIVTAASHEAVMYSGGDPEEFDISASISLLKNGTNVLAIQGHNTSGSSDFSLIPYLTVGSNSFRTNETESFILTGEGNLHTNFKIAKEGETLYLRNSEDILIDSSEMASLNDDISYGRYPDGGDQWFYFAEPTSGGENINPLDSVFSDTIHFSHEGGFYGDSFQLSLISTSKDTGAIRYTTDGSEPTAYSGLYTEPIPISTTKVVRAVWIATNGQKNPITSHSFIFDDNNELPVVSISTDPYHLFNWEEGIFALGPNAESSNPFFGANFWMDWEKPINFEYFDNQQVQHINQGAGIKVAGNWSRANDQKSVALYARKNYGSGSFKHKFFNDRDNGSFESIMLRNSGNDWRSTMFRDGLVSEIAKDMDMERMAYQPSKVYINGQYWGILNMREKPSEHYFSENFGIEEDELNILELAGDVVYGDNAGYVNLRNIINTKSLSIDENYRQVSGMMDISCFIDYEILQIYIDNGDWPGNNIKFWNTNNPMSKWRWLIFDTDFGFNLYNSNGNTLQFATTANGSSWPNPPWSTLFLRKLLTNQDFKNRFVNRFLDCMNTKLQADKLLYKVDSIQDLLEPEIENHLQNWGFSYDSWINEVERIRTYIKNRNYNMQNYIRDFFSFNTGFQITLNISDRQGGAIKINTIIPDDYPFRGTYFGEVPITIRAIPKAGYRFVGWEGGSNSTALSLTVNLTSNKTYTAIFEPAEEKDLSIVINEINYKSSDEFDAGDWIELYNNGKQTVDLSGWILSDGEKSNRYLFQEGLSISPGEYLVVIEDQGKFSSQFPLVKNITGELSFGLSSDGETVYLYDNESNLIDMIDYGVAPPWPNGPCGLGPTLELKTPDSDNGLAENWLAGEIGGTPGSQNSIYVTTESIVSNVDAFTCFPTFFNDYTTLQFYAKREGTYSVYIIDLQGKVYDIYNGIQHSGGYCNLDLFVNAERYPSGIYLVKVLTDETSRTIKVIKR